MNPIFDFFAEIGTIFNINIRSEQQYFKKVVIMEFNAEKNSGVQAHINPSINKTCSSQPTTCSWPQHSGRMVCVK